MLVPKIVPQCDSLASKQELQENKEFPISTMNGIKSNWRNTQIQESVHAILAVELAVADGLSGGYSAMKLCIYTISPRYNSYCLKILADVKISANDCSETES